MPSEQQSKYMKAKPSGSTAPKQTSPMWITNYNLLSGGLWAFILLNTIITAIFFGQPEMFTLTNNWVVLVQCCAVVEIYNSAVGNVKSPLLTTVMQVASRLLIVLGIFKALPYSPGNYHWVYITLCIAWSTTETVRYYYYAAKLLTHDNTPKKLTWLRYSLFTVLYPMGISSEVSIIYKSLDEAQFVYGAVYKYFLIACLAIYVPGSYTLYSYMLKQRKKQMKKLAEGDKHKKEVEKKSE